MSGLEHNCVEPKEGIQYTLLKEFNVPTGIKPFVSLFWNDRDFFVRYLEVNLKDLNVSVGDWTLEGPDKKLRGIRCEHPSKWSFPGLPLPTHTKTTKTQILEVSKSGKSLVIKETNQFHGIPYSDYFNVVVKWQVEEVSAFEVNVQIMLGFDFFKSTWMQGTIEWNTRYTAAISIANSIYYSLYNSLLRIELNAVYDEWFAAALILLGGKPTPLSHHITLTEGLSIRTSLSLIRSMMVGVFFFQLIYETVYHSKLDAFLMKAFQSPSTMDFQDASITSFMAIIGEHINRFVNVNDGFQTWFFGSCVFLVELLHIYLQLGSDPEAPPSKAILTFFTQKIPTISLLFVLMGGIHFLLEGEHGKIKSNFQVECIDENGPSLRSIIVSYFTAFVFSKELFFWGTMRLFFLVGTSQENSLGSVNFAILVVSIIFLSHSFELLIWAGPQLWGLQCQGPLVPEVGFSDVTFGLIFIDHIISLRKVHSFTSNSDCSSMNKCLDYVFLTIFDICLLVVSPSWPHAYLFLIPFTVYALFSPYTHDRQIHGSLESVETIKLSRDLPEEECSITCNVNLLSLLSHIFPINAQKSVSDNKKPEKRYLYDVLDFSLPTYMVPFAIVAKCISPCIIPISFGALVLNIFLNMYSIFDLCFSLAVVNLFDMFWWPMLIETLERNEIKSNSNKNKNMPRKRHWFTIIDQLISPFFFIRLVTGGSDVGHFSGLLAGLVVIILVYSLGLIGRCAIPTAGSGWYSYEKDVTITPDFIPLMLLVDDLQPRISGGKAKPD
jgi:hypothetical protein